MRGLVKANLSSATRPDAGSVTPKVVGAPGQNHAATQLLVPILFVLLCAATAKSELYEFTLTGDVRGSSLANVSVGDPLLMRFVAESNDLNPDPAIGRYAAGDVKMEFPNEAFTERDPPGFIQVDLRPTVEGYLAGFYVKDSAGFFYTADVVLTVGPGIFPSDALPLTLPILLNEQMLFHLSLGVNPNVTGVINSYSSREVPEPLNMSFAAISVLMAIKIRNRRK